MIGCICTPCFYRAYVLCQMYSRGIPGTCVDPPALLGVNGTGIFGATFHFNIINVFVDI